MVIRDLYKMTVKTEHHLFQEAFDPTFRSPLTQFTQYCRMHLLIYFTRERVSPQNFYLEFAIIGIIIKKNQTWHKNTTGMCVVIRGIDKKTQRPSMIMLRECTPSCSLP